MKCCPTCGRDMPPQIKVTGPIRQRIVDLIANRQGISMGDLVSLVYADRNEEPDWAANSIKTTIYYANKQLKPQGFKITSTMGPGALYSLVPLRSGYWTDMWSKPFDWNSWSS